MRIRLTIDVKSIGGKKKFQNAIKKLIVCQCKITQLSAYFVTVTYPQCFMNYKFTVLRCPTVLHNTENDAKCHRKTISV